MCAHRSDHVWVMPWSDPSIRDKDYPHFRGPKLRDEWSRLMLTNPVLSEEGHPYWFKDMYGNVVTNANLEQLAQLAIQQPQLFKNAKAQVPDTKA